MGNTKKLNNLLKKKSWTGKEVGQLLIASMINDIKQLGQSEKKPLFSQADFDKMESSLASDKDFDVYGVYRNLYISIIDCYNNAQGNYQQFFNGFSHLSAVLSEAEHADNAQAAFDQTPVIMTESQYKRLKNEILQSYRETKDSYYTLLFNVLRDCLNALNESKEAPEPIKSALEATKNIPAETISFSRSYNSMRQWGYYSLPNGQRSDRMTDEEWQAAKEEYFDATHSAIDGEAVTIEQYTEQCSEKCRELFFYGANRIREYVFKKTGKQLDGTDTEIEKSLETLIYSLDYYDLFEALDDPISRMLKEALDYPAPTTWHLYEELPEGLTAYDLLTEFNFSDIKELSGTDAKDFLKKFKNEYQELYTTLKTYIEELVPEVKGLKANQLYKKIFSWGDLADAGVFNYMSIEDITSFEIADTLRKDHSLVSNYSRAIRGGIAILTDLSPSNIDENGDYIEPKSPLRFFKTVYDLDSHPQVLSDLNHYVNGLIYPALSYIYAFNSLITILAKIYDLPELPKVVYCNTQLIESKISRFNTSLYSFYFDGVYGNEDKKKRKRAIIKRVFKPLNVDAMKPSQEAIDSLTAELAGMGFSSDARNNLKHLDSLIALLMKNEEGA